MARETDLLVISELLSLAQIKAYKIPEIGKRQFFIGYVVDRPPEQTWGLVFNLQIGSIRECEYMRNGRFRYSGGFFYQDPSVKAIPSAEFRLHILISEALAQLSTLEQIKPSLPFD